MKRITITSGGQLSLPAAIRHRWGTRTVNLFDNGDHVVLKPAPDDPIEATYGMLKDYPGPSADESRRLAREEEREAEERKYGPMP